MQEIPITGPAEGATAGQSLGRITEIITSEFGVDARLERGWVAITCLQGGLFRVAATAGSERPQPPRSYALTSQPEPQAAQIHEKNDEIGVASTCGEVRLQHEGAISLYAPDGELVSGGVGLYSEDEWLWDRRAIADKEDFYGLGERMTPLGRRGYRIDNFNWDQAKYHSEVIERMYASFPFCVALRAGRRQGWGLFLDSSYRTLFDIGYHRWDRLATGVFRGDYVAYFFCAAPLAELIRRYTDLTGRHGLPPLWALGYHQCRYSYMSAEEAREVGRAMRAHRLPCDAIWYDIDYMDSYRVFTLNRANFDANHFRDMARDGMEFRSVVIVDPALKHDPPGRYPHADEAAEKGYFLKTESGEDYIGTVWPGKVRFPDFSRAEVRDWWAEKHRFYFEELGIDGIWNDMNEPADLETHTLPDSIKMYDDGYWSTHDRMHNVYALFMIQAAYSAARRFRPNERPFQLTRSGAPGIQRYSAVWTGDNASSWHHMQMSLYQIINMGLSGIGFCGADIGGFFSNTTPELLARWYQLGTFYPFMRNHSMLGSIHQEPWAFGEQTANICRAALELRYRLLPYLYQLFQELHRSGAPIMRPLFWHYDMASHAIDQFLFGRYLLVAPVLGRGQTSKSVWLPPGVWYDFASDRRYEGSSAGTTIVVDAPLDTIPIFVRAGSILPCSTPIQHSGQFDPTHLILDIYPFDVQSGDQRPSSERLNAPLRERLYTDFLAAARPDDDSTDSMDDGADELELTTDNRFRYRRHPQSSLRSLTIRTHRLDGRPDGQLATVSEQRLDQPEIEIKLE